MGEMTESDAKKCSEEPEKNAFQNTGALSLRDPGQLNTLKF